MIYQTIYEVPLTDAELLKLSDEIAALCRTISDKKESVKTECALLRKEIKELQGKLDEKLDTLRCRREPRNVKLRVTYDRPEPGRKEIRNADTGELYDTVDMTDDEKNDLLVRSEIGAESSDPSAPEAETPAAPPAEDPADPGIEAPEDASTDESGDMPVIDISDNEEEIVLEDGKYYRHDGQLFRAEKSGHKPCINCFFFEAVACPNVDCDQNDQILVPATPPAPSPEAQAEDPADPAPSPEAPEAPQSRICSHCGAVRSGIRVYRMPNDRNLCGECLAKRRRNALAALNEKWEVLKRKGRDYLLFRTMPVRSNGAAPELTQFKFATGKNGAWENPIYFPGDCGDAQTEAGKYYETLIAEGAREG